MIRFKNLRWKNLLSTGNTFTELSFDSHPTTLILGKNGSGKSTILDALCYALFKKPFRKINKDILVNTVNNTDCLIEVEFEIGTTQYKVVRGIKPDIFEIYIDGEKRKTEAAIKDPQAFLVEDVLKVNYDSFLQVVILGNAKYTPFMQLTTPKRREFIEQILDIGVFSTMNEVLSNRQKTLKIELDSIDKDLVMTREQISLVQGFIAKIKEEANRVKDEIVEQVEQGNCTIDSLLEEIQDFNEQIAVLEIEIKDATKVADGIQRLNDEEQRGTEIVRQTESKIAFYTNNDECKTCGQDIACDHKERILREKQEQLDAYNAVLATIRETRKKRRVRDQEIREVQKQIHSLRLQEQERTNNIKGLRTYVKKLEADLQKQPGNAEEHEKKLLNLEQKIVRLTNSREEAVEQRHFYDVATVLLKDSGIKAAIIKQYLPAINKLVNQYLESFEFFLSFSLDENFNETFKSRHRDTLSYYSFSEGEKLRIDLALLFAWREVARMKNSCATNLLILDEVIDKSLDTEGTDYVIRLFNELGKQSNVLVISHKQDAALDLFSRVIQFEKVANFSRMVEAA